MTFTKPPYSLYCEGNQNWMNYKKAQTINKYVFQSLVGKAFYNDE